MAEWTAASGELSARVPAESEMTLRACAVQPTLGRGHIDVEATTLAVGCRQRQMLEWVLKVSDGMFIGPARERLRVCLTGPALDYANEGASIKRHRVAASLMAHLSAERGERIGDLGLGFNSVLSVTSTPNLAGRAGSVGLDEACSLEGTNVVLPDVKKVVPVPRPTGGS